MKVQLTQSKLGYGGTKSEMERLLADAKKLSGVKYNIDNLGDVYSAIHVIQEDLGLTGVAADEASTTFTGSMGAMKAAAENLMANLALGEDVSDELNVLSQTVFNFVKNNLLPMLGNILKGIPTLFDGLMSEIIRGLNIAGNGSGEILQIGLDIINSLITSIVTNIPYLIESLLGVVSGIATAFMSIDWVQVATDLINDLKDGLDLAAGEILGTDSFILTDILDGIMAGATSLLSSGYELISTLLNGLYEGITANLSTLLAQGTEILMSIVNGVLDAAPVLIAQAGELVYNFASFVAANLPTILAAGRDLLIKLVDGIKEKGPAIAQSALNVIVKFAAAVANNLPLILQKGIELLGRLLAGIIQAIPKIPGTIKKVINAIKEKFSGFDWKEIGINILKGVKEGIINATKMVVDAAKKAASEIWDGIKGFFKIESPSRLTEYAGEMIDAGLAKGIAGNEGIVDKAVQSLNTSASSALQVSTPAWQFAPQEDSTEALYKLLAQYLPVIASGENTHITLEGDAGRLFRLMQRESIRNTQLVGTGAVLAAH